MNSTDFVKMISSEAARSEASAAGEVDLSILRSYIDHPKDFIGYVNVYLRQTAADISQLDAACLAGDDPAWVAAAHRLTGSAGMAGAARLQALCAQAQRMNPALMTDRSRLLDEIHIAFARTRRYLLGSLSQFQSGH